MASELGWDAARKAKEIKDGKAFLQTMGIVHEDDAVRATFSPLDIVKYRRVFNEYAIPLSPPSTLPALIFVSFDADKNGLLNSKELGSAFEKSGEKISSEELQTILKGLSKDGENIRFDEFLDVRFTFPSPPNPKLIIRQLVAKIHQGKSPRQMDKFSALLKGAISKQDLERTSGDL